MATWYIKLVDDELVGLVGDVLQNDWNMTNWSEKGYARSQDNIEKGANYANSMKL